MNSAQGRVSQGGDLTVRATTIDDTVRDLGLQSVDFIKMDIEGAERRALRGGRDTLARFQPRMVVCLYHGLDDQEVVPRVVLELQPQYQFVRTTKVGYFFSTIRVPTDQGTAGHSRDDSVIAHLAGIE